MTHPDSGQYPAPTPLSSQTGFSQKILRAFSGVEESLPQLLAEKYPHVLSQIDKLWPTEEVITYLNQLLVLDRNQRDGFDPEAVKEIMYLIQLHSLIYSRPGGARLSAHDQHLHDATIPLELQDIAQNASIRDVAIETAIPTATSRKISDYDEHWGELVNESELREFWEAKKTSKVRTRLKLGQILVDNGVLLSEELELALTLQQQMSPSPKLGHILSDMGMCMVTDIRKALSMQSDIAIVNLERLNVDIDITPYLEQKLLTRLRAAPLLVTGKTMFVAVPNPLSFNGTNDLAFRTKKQIELVHARTPAILALLDKLFS